MLSERPGPDAAGLVLVRRPLVRARAPARCCPVSRLPPCESDELRARRQALVHLRADEEQHHRQQHPGHRRQQDPLERALDPERSPARRGAGLPPPPALGDQPLPAVAGRAEAVAQPAARLVDLVLGLVAVLGPAAALWRWAEHGRAARISVRHGVVYSVRACRHGASSVSTPGAPSCSAASWTRRWPFITGCTGAFAGSTSSELLDVVRRRRGGGPRGRSRRAPGGLRHPRAGATRPPGR